MRKDAIDSMRAAVVLLAFCMATLLCAIWPHSAYAASSGSIELSCTIERDGAVIVLEGDGYALTRVASAEVDDESASVSYVVEDEFDAVDRDWLALDGAGVREAAHEVFDYAESQGVEPVATACTDSSGRVAFSSVDAGLYLVSRIAVAPENAMFSCDPLLVSVPMSLEEGLEYEAKVSPKFEQEDLRPEPPGDPDGSDGQVGQGAIDDIADALGFAKTSDAVAALAAVAAACACVAAALLAWRRRMSHSVRGAHAPPAKAVSSDDSDA